MNFTPLILLLTLATTGCLMHERRQQAKYVDPVLPTSISRQDLVDYLNEKTKGLESWRCVNTQVHVRSPELLIAQKLKGTLACASPGRFRLVCDNTVGHADFGANAEICWAYAKPGESVVMTWKHEDSSLLQYLPGGLPRLEPDWLMMVLGVEPLDPERYELQNAPLGSREVWLVAVENASDGTSLRRVIKVDTVTGTIRRHALYDSDAKPLLVADLSDYKSSGGHELPHTIRIEFPQTETQLTLKFTGIETGCQIPESLWSPPQGRNLEFMDLGDVVRLKMQKNPAFARSIEGTRKAERAAFGDANRTAMDGPSRVSAEVSPAPQFDEEPGDDSKFYSASSTHEDSGPTESDTQQMIDDKFARAMNEDSAVPEFDIVAPQKAVRGRRPWLPFWKK